MCQRHSGLKPAKIKLKKPFKPAKMQAAMDFLTQICKLSVINSFLLERYFF